MDNLLRPFTRNPFILFERFASITRADFSRNRQPLLIPFLRPTAEIFVHVFLSESSLSCNLFSPSTLTTLAILPTPRGYVTKTGPRSWTHHFGSARGFPRKGMPGIPPLSPVSQTAIIRQHHLAPKSCYMP